MPLLRSGAVTLSLTLLVAAGCSNKTPARAVLQETGQALEAAGPQLQEYAPEELSAIRVGAQQAQAQFDAARYTDALRLAQRLPGRIQMAAQLASRRKQERLAAWQPLAERVPMLLEGIAVRGDELAAVKRPAQAEEDAVAAARGDLAAVRKEWTGAVATLDSGRARTAVEMGLAVQAKAEALAARLGLSPAAAMAAAAAAEARAAGAAAEARAAQAAPAGTTSGPAAPAGAAAAGTAARAVGTRALASAPGAPVPASVRAPLPPRP